MMIEVEQSSPLHNGIHITANAFYETIYSSLAEQSAKQLPASPFVSD